MLISNIAKEENYNEGDTIFKEGDKGGSLIVILEGTVKIYKETVSGIKNVLASLDKNNMFGELSIFDELPRSATAVSATKSRCIVIKTDDLVTLMNNNQSLAVNLLKQVIKTLSNRIRNTNEKLHDNIFWGITAKL